MHAFLNPLYTCTYTSQHRLRIYYSPGCKPRPVLLAFCTTVYLLCYSKVLCHRRASSQSKDYALVRMMSVRLSSAEHDKILTPSQMYASGQGINEQTSTENSGTPGELSSFNSLRRSTANGSSQTSATVNRSGTHITRKATQTSPATTQNHASVLTTQASPLTHAVPSRVTVVQFQTSTITVKPLNNALITEKPTTPVVQSPADGSPSTMSQSEGNVSPTIINSVSRPS